MDPIHESMHDNIRGGLAAFLQPPKTSPELEAMHQQMSQMQQDSPEHAMMGAADPQEEEILASALRRRGFEGPVSPEQRQQLLEEELKLKSAQEDALLAESDPMAFAAKKKAEYDDIIKQMAQPYYEAEAKAKADGTFPKMPGEAAPTQAPAMRQPPRVAPRPSNQAPGEGSRAIRQEAPAPQPVPRQRQYSQQASQAVPQQGRSQPPIAQRKPVTAPPAQQPPGGTNRPGPSLEEVSGVKAFQDAQRADAMDSLNRGSMGGPGMRSASPQEIVAHNQRSTYTPQDPYAVTSHRSQVGPPKGYGEAIVRGAAAPITGAIGAVDTLGREGLGNTIKKGVDGLLALPGRAVDTLNPASGLSGPERVQNVVEGGMLAAPGVKRVLSQAERAGASGGESMANAQRTQGTAPPSQRDVMTSGKGQVQGSGEARGPQRSAGARPARGANARAVQNAKANGKPVPTQKEAARQLQGEKNFRNEVRSMEGKPQQGATRMRAVNELKQKNADQALMKEFGSKLPENQKAVSPTQQASNKLLQEDFSRKVNPPTQKLKPSQDASNKLLQEDFQRKVTPSSNKPTAASSAKDKLLQEQFSKGNVKAPGAPATRTLNQESMIMAREQAKHRDAGIAARRQQREAAKPKPAKKPYTAQSSNEPKTSPKPEAVARRSKKKENLDDELKGVARKYGTKEHNNNHNKFETKQHPKRWENAGREPKPVEKNLPATAPRKRKEAEPSVKDKLTEKVGEARREVRIEREVNASRYANRAVTNADLAKDKAGRVTPVAAKPPGRQAKPAAEPSGQGVEAKSKPSRQRAQRSDATGARNSDLKEAPQEMTKDYYRNPPPYRLRSKAEATAYAARIEAENAKRKAEGRPPVNFSKFGPNMDKPQPKTDAAKVETAKKAVDALGGPGRKINFPPRAERRGTPSESRLSPKDQAKVVAEVRKRGKERDKAIKKEQIVPFGHFNEKGEPKAHPARPKKGKKK